MTRQRDRSAQLSGGGAESSIFDESAVEFGGPTDPVGSTDDGARTDGGFFGPEDVGESSADSWIWTIIQRYTPRRERKLGLATLVFLLLVVLSLGTGQTLAHTSFTASDVNFTSNSGRLTSLTVAPDGDIHYDGLEAVPSSVDIQVLVRLNSSASWELVDSTSVTASGLQGSVNYSFAEVDLLTSSSMNSNDFRAGDGATSTTEIDIRIEATLVGAGPGGTDIVTSATDTFTVMVTNEPAGGQVGGRANTGGSAA